jgi:hypothetical protein
VLYLVKLTLNQWWFFQLQSLLEEPVECLVLLLCYVQRWSEVKFLPPWNQNRIWWRQQEKPQQKWIKTINQSIHFQSSTTTKSMWQVLVLGSIGTANGNSLIFNNTTILLSSTYPTLPRVCSARTDFACNYHNVWNLPAPIQ